MSAPSLKRVPLFPLPGVVLFPGAILPLRVFEPRYLRLLNDALSSDKLIGMPQIKPSPAYLTNPNATPDLHGVLGVGLIVAQDQLSDGTWHIALLGQGRYRLEGEVPHQPYRIGEVRPVEEQLPHTPQQCQTLAALQATMLQTAERLIGRTMEAEAQQQLREALHQRRDAGALSDMLASIFVQDSALRQALLESSDVLTRVRLVHAVMRKLGERVQKKPTAKLGGEDVCLN